MENELGKLFLKAWKIIAGLGIILGIIVAIFTLSDRFLSDKTLPENELLTESKISEYIFGNRYYYVQALVSEGSKVIAYAITTRDKNFNPKITILEKAGCLDPESNNKIIFASKDIILGKTTFADLAKNQPCSYFDQPENIYSMVGARRFYYHEEYYFGNPGNYQSYFFAINDSGFSDVEDIPQLFFGDQEIDPSNSEVLKFRQNSIINTLQITSPSEGWTNEELRKYLVGPDYDQIRVIPESILQTKETESILETKLKNLSTEVNIQVFISLLGEPLMINKEPAGAMRTDKTIGERFDDKYNEK